MALAMTDQILAVARAFCAARQLSLSRVSTLVFNDGKKLDLIARGADLQTARFEQAMQWFAANWPPNARWPAGVPRPLRRTTLVRSVSAARRASRG